MGFIIKENFLDKEFFNRLKDLIFSNDISWFFRSSMSEGDHYFFNHSFYNDYRPFSVFFDDFIYPVVKKLDAKGINEIRANLLIKQDKVYQSNFHVDKPYKCKTAVLYMNTCNGYTILKNQKIKCEENKILIFDSEIEHAIVSQTDTDRRIIINFNYF